MEGKGPPRTGLGGGVLVCLGCDRNSEDVVAGDRGSVFLGSGGWTSQGRAGQDGAPWGPLLGADACFCLCPHLVGGGGVSRGSCYKGINPIPKGSATPDLTSSQSPPKGPTGSQRLNSVGTQTLRPQQVPRLRAPPFLPGTPGVSPAPSPWGPHGPSPTPETAPPWTLPPPLHGAPHGPSQLCLGSPNGLSCPGSLDPSMVPPAPSFWTLPHGLPSRLIYGLLLVPPYSYLRVLTHPPKCLRM